MRSNRKRFMCYLCRSTGGMADAQPESVNLYYIGFAS